MRGRRRRERDGRIDTVWWNKSDWKGKTRLKEDAGETREGEKKDSGEESYE